MSLCSENSKEDARFDIRYQRVPAGTSVVFIEDRKKRALIICVKLTAQNSSGRWRAKEGRGNAIMV